MVPHHFHVAIFARNRESLSAPAMQFRRKITLPGLLALLAGALIVRVVIVVALSYRHYFPPDFQNDFLLGRESYFFGVYRWAFYGHILHCTRLEGSRQETICRASPLDVSVLHAALFGGCSSVDRRSCNVDGHFSRVGLCERGLAQLVGALVGL